MLYYKLIRGSVGHSVALCLDCRESSYFHTTMLCVFSNIIGGFILLHFNCDSVIPAEGRGLHSFHSLHSFRYVWTVGRVHTFIQQSYACFQAGLYFWISTAIM